MTRGTVQNHILEKWQASNHNATKVAADDSAEEEDASLVSSDESDLTDSEDLEEDLDRGYNSMENSSTSVDSMSRLHFRAFSCNS